MGFYDDVKKKMAEAAPGLSEKAIAGFSSAKTMVTEAALKTAPIIKDVSGKAATYAQEKSPIIKAQALQAFDDAKKYRLDMKLNAETDAAAKAEYLRIMYDTALPPENLEFISEPFFHFENQLYFFDITGEVLDTDKRSDLNVVASSSGGGSSYGGIYGSHADASSFLHARTKTRHEFWVKNGDVEQAVELGDSDIPLRKGQMVSLMYVARQGNDNGLLCLIYNHNTQSGYQVLSPEQINQHLRIYTEVPGMFNGKAVRARRARLLSELARRMTELCHWAKVNQGRVTNFTLDGN
jgi:hypothetical protein